MIEITSATAPPPVVDLARFRAVVPRYQWTEIAVRLWGERSRDQVAVLAPSSSSASQGACSLTDA